MSQRRKENDRGRAEETEKARQIPNLGNKWILVLTCLLTQTQYWSINANIFVARYFCIKKTNKTKQNKKKPFEKLQDVSFITAVT